MVDYPLQTMADHHLQFWSQEKCIRKWNGLRQIQVRTLKSFSKILDCPTIKGLNEKDFEKHVEHSDGEDDCYDSHIAKEKSARHNVTVPLHCKAHLQEEGSTQGKKGIRNG
jgi:hypothetical protein